MAKTVESNPELFSEKDIDSNEDVLFARRGCCFWIPCIGSERSKDVGSVWWERIRTADKEERWWTRGWRAVIKLREWSEIVAGPRWKTFIRRFNRNNNYHHHRGNARKFQYDPLSYALNFDEGPGQNDHSDDDRAYRDFSSRYASLPVSAKSSMDLGKDGPPFT